MMKLLEGVDALNFGVMGVDKLLDGLYRRVLELLEDARTHCFLDLLQMIDAYVLVAVLLEDVARDLAALEANRVYEMAILTASAAVRAVVVAAGDGSVIARLDNLTGLLNQALLRRKLAELGQLESSPLLVDLLELEDFFVGERDEHLRRLSWSLLKQTANMPLLL